MYIFQDLKNNPKNIKAKIVLVLFRLAQLCRKTPKPFFYILIPYLIFYRVIVEWILCIELPWNTKVGKGLSLFHGQSLVVNDGTIIGENCTLRHCTTIGNKQLENGEFSKAPIIEDNVDIGSNVVILGPITIGRGSIIGAGSVVVKDVEPYSLVVGNPARVIKIIKEKIDEKN